MSVVSICGQADLNVIGVTEQSGQQPAIKVRADAVGTIRRFVGQIAVAAAGIDHLAEIGQPFAGVPKRVPTPQSIR